MGPLSYLVKTCAAATGASNAGTRVSRVAWGRHSPKALGCGVDPLAFSAALRTTEAVTLRRWQIVSVEVTGQVVLHLPKAKSGGRRGIVQAIVIDDAMPPRLLRALPPSQNIACGVVRRFRAVFRLLLVDANVGDLS